MNAHEIAQGNTRAQVYYVARCAPCGSQADLDGDEYATTPERAYEIVLAEADWYADEKGNLLCDDCRPDDEDRA